MNLTLAEAAERAKMTMRQMMVCIENGTLVAASQTQDGELQIAPEDLESFLKSAPLMPFGTMMKKRITKRSTFAGMLRQGICAAS